MGDNIMFKQIILHYPGSYVERPHTIIFESEEEYQEFLAKKFYKLKPNVTYGVFVLNNTISTEYSRNNLKINGIQKSANSSKDTNKNIEIKQSSINTKDDVIIID